MQRRANWNTVSDNVFSVPSNLMRLSSRTSHADVSSIFSSEINRMLKVICLPPFFIHLDLSGWVIVSLPGLLSCQSQNK